MKRLSITVVRLAGSTDGAYARAVHAVLTSYPSRYSCASRYFSVSAAKPFNSLTSAFSQSFVAGAIYRGTFRTLPGLAPGLLTRSKAKKGLDGPHPAPLQALKTTV